MQTIDCSVYIEAPASTVWRVFADPEVSRRMGGEYVSNWKPGGSFGWKSNVGEMLTNGRILDVEPGRLLRHELYAGSSQIVASVITYRFDQEEDVTTLVAIEEMHRPLESAEYEEAVRGWQEALEAVKEIAERL